MRLSNGYACCDTCGYHRLATPDEVSQGHCIDECLRCFKIEKKYPDLKDWILDVIHEAISEHVGKYKHDNWDW